MAAIPVTSANTNNQTNGGRVLVRTSAGIPYVVVCDGTDASIEVWKADAVTPTTFTEQDTADNPDATTYGSMSAAIDSDGVIHIVFVEYASKSDDLEYITYNTTTDQFGTIATINADLGGESTSIANLYTSIAIDANDIPHVAYVGVEASAGTIGQVVRYENRINGSWIGTGVEVEGQTGNVDCLNPDIAINANNIPVISYLNDADDDLVRATGNANDATSFTIVDLDATATSGSRTSICVDSAGTVWVAGVDSDGTIMVYENTTQRDTGTTGTAPSLVADGTTIYLFYEDANNDIAYDKWTGAAWTGSTVLEAGTYNTVKTKWGFWVDNDSTGSLISIVQGSLVDSYSEANYNSDYNGTSTAANRASQSFTGIGGVLHSVSFYLKKTGTITDSSIVRVSTHSGTFGTSSVPGTSIAQTSIPAASIGTSYALVTATFYGQEVVEIQNGVNYVVEIVLGSTGMDGSNYISVGRDTTSPTHAGNAAFESGGSMVAASGTDIPFYLYVMDMTRLPATELDYTFADETASPDIQWNKLTLIAPAAANSNFFMFFTVP